MFPILKGVNKPVTKGFYFPFPAYYFNSNVNFYIGGYKYHPIITLDKSNKLLFQLDSGVEIHFLVPSFNLNRASNVSIAFVKPDKTIFQVDGIVVNNHTLAYINQPNDFIMTGSWKYQIAVRFSPSNVYHLNTGKFKIRKSIGG